MIGMPDLDAAHQFLAAHGRVLDLRRFERLFLGGDPAPVRDAVAAYRNADGGFGHGARARRPHAGQPARRHRAGAADPRPGRRLGRRPRPRRLRPAPGHARRPRAARCSSPPTSRAGPPRRGGSPQDGASLGLHRARSSARCTRAGSSIRGSSSATELMWELDRRARRARRLRPLRRPALPRPRARPRARGGGARARRAGARARRHARPRGARRDPLARSSFAPDARTRSRAGCSTTPRSPPTSTTSPPVSRTTAAGPSTSRPGRPPPRRTGAAASRSTRSTRCGATGAL